VSPSPQRLPDWNANAAGIRAFYFRDPDGHPLEILQFLPGPEQERLNNVIGARLRITTLRAAAGPAVELLEYLTPRDGRPLPADTRANDLVHWHTIALTPDIQTAARVLAAPGRALVSPGLVALPGAALGFREGFVVRDPDGHALQFRAQ
jgi:hypothetical protein